MLAALAKTGNVSAAARAAEISRSPTTTGWRRIRPTPPPSKEAMEEAIEVLEAAARRRAINGSDTLLIFLLKSLRPERYRERHQIEHTAKGTTLAEALAMLRQDRPREDPPEEAAGSPRGDEGGAARETPRNGGG